MINKKFLTNLFNILFSLFLSAFFGYLAFKNIIWKDVVSSLQSAHYLYAIITSLFTVLILFLKSYRWGIILPLKKIKQWPLFSITSIGFMAIDLLPIRMGELVRPYLITQKHDIKMSSSLATILIERIYDFASLILILMVVLLFVTLPTWVFRAGLIIVAIIVPLLILLTIIMIKKQASLKIIDTVLSRLPSSFSLRVQGMIHSFLDGLEILPDLRRSFSVALFSLLIWGLNGFAIYILFFSFDLHLPFVVGYVILIMTALGLVLPAAPGFVGNFHYFTKAGLVLFGVPETQALTFAIIFHLTQFLPPIFCGLCFLPFYKISLPSLLRDKENK
jgi:hypothetical protein